LLLPLTGPLATVPSDEPQDLAKRAAACAAADLVQDGMLLGLGGGSTFLFVIERLGERIRQERLRVRGVPTSVSLASRVRHTRATTTRSSEAIE